MVTDRQSNSWNTFDCPATTRRWRVRPDHLIEIEGKGIPLRPWPKTVDDWAELIAVKAAKYEIPAYWIAAIMALETRGKPHLCLKNNDGSCNTREGMGLMAMLIKPTASGLAGRQVTEQELLYNYDLQIDLGAKLIARLSKIYQGDYVKVAIGYNAGSVRCGNGNTFQLPKEPCPATPWGVVQGCVRSPSANRPHCAPSTVVPGQFACPVDYPQAAIRTHNSALGRGYTERGLENAPVPVPPNGAPPNNHHKPDPEPAPAQSVVLPFASGLAAGYLATVIFVEQLQKHITPAGR